MARRKANSGSSKRIEALRHRDATRTNIPTAEYQSVMDAEQRRAHPVTYARNSMSLERETEGRNPDLDPQLIWRGKDQIDWSDLVVYAPPLYIQEKVHPKVLIDDLRRHAEAAERATAEQPDLFGDFNGIPDGADRTDFYRHEGKWQNRMILGDSLQVMASLAEREGLRGKVQCIYIDPPYGIRFNSNFQWSTTSRDVRDGNAAHITREPEQVKAFRDTWRDGIHSYLTYLRDRLLVARDLLAESGSVFVQIGDENVHRVRALLDEVFGAECIVSQISVQTTTGFPSKHLGNVADYVLWYARNPAHLKSRAPRFRKAFELGEGNARWLRLSDFSSRGVTAAEKRGESQVPRSSRPYAPDNLLSQGRASSRQPFTFRGRTVDPWTQNSHWKAAYPDGMTRLGRAERIHTAEASLRYIRYHTDYELATHGNVWTDTSTGNFTEDKIYVVQTNTKVVERCLLMASDPGDLVLDPTCGSGTTAYVAEQWGRRWITVDTSRVALALARARLMGARYPYYLLADSREGQLREAEATRTTPKTTPTHSSVRQGFVYERVPHITLKAIANNVEIDTIWEQYQEKLEPLRADVNRAVGASWEEWEIPLNSAAGWSDAAKKAHAAWWKLRLERQQDIDGSIAAKAEHEYLYDRPYEGRGVVRVAGPFTVESVSPHRMLSEGAEGELLDPATSVSREEDAFVEMILENLRVAGVQQAHKQDRIAFKSLVSWPGAFACAEGRYLEGGSERRAGVFIGPEFGTVARPDLVEAAREAADAGFDVLIACAFNYDAHAAEFTKLGRVPVLKARMNADLHMAEDLKSTGRGNLFVLFGEPEIELSTLGNDQLQVQVVGVDVFDPTSGEVRSDDVAGIACWFVDTDYDGESFFVRQAYFLGANDPYKSLKVTLRAEIDEDAWATLNSDTSRPFPKPSTGRIAVKVINHLGDEVLKVLRVET